jgi:hypothetical protein
MKAQPPPCVNQHLDGLLPERSREEWPGLHEHPIMVVRCTHAHFVSPGPGKHEKPHLAQLCLTVHGGLHPSRPLIAPEVHFVHLRLSHHEAEVRIESLGKWEGDWNERCKGTARQPRLSGGTCRDDQDPRQNHEFALNPQLHRSRVPQADARFATYSSDHANSRVA